MDAMAAAGAPGFQGVSLDQHAVLMRDKQAVALGEKRTTCNDALPTKDQPLASQWRRRILERSGHGDWVSTELVQLAVNVLLGPGMDAFLNAPPGWGKTVVMMMLLLAGTGVCTAMFPLKALALQVVDRLTLLATEANARARELGQGVVVHVFHVSPDLLAGSTDALRQRHQLLQRLVLQARRNAEPVVVLVFGPEALGVAKFRELLRQVGR